MYFGVIPQANTYGPFTSTGCALSCAAEVRELHGRGSCHEKLQSVVWQERDLAAELVLIRETTAACGHSLLAGFLQPVPKA